MLLKELPASERPRERAIKNGVCNLSLSELLAIIIRTGSKKFSALETANMILSKISKVQDLNYLTTAELKELEGIGETKAITILSAIEIGKRINQSEHEKIIFLQAFEVYNYLKNEVKHLQEEHLYVLYLNSKGKLIEKKLISIGTINQTLIDSKIIFKWAYKLSATAFILVHNHPSGDPNPSQQDLKITEIIVHQAKTLGLIFVDHIIIGNDYYSFVKNTNIF